jgi:hypothetical protein
MLNKQQQRYKKIFTESSCIDEFIDYKYRIAKCYINHTKMHIINKMNNKNFIREPDEYYVSIKLQDSIISYDELMTRINDISYVHMCIGSKQLFHPEEIYRLPKSGYWTSINILTVTPKLINEILNEIEYTKNIVNGFNTDDFNTYIHHNIVITNKKDIDWIKKLKDGDKIVECNEEKRLTPLCRNAWIFEVRYYPINRLVAVIDKQYNKYSKSICDFTYG